MADKGRIYLSPPHMTGRERDYVQQVFDDNWIAPVGPQLTQFETKLAERVGVPYAVASSSGTAGLHLVLHHLGIQPDDEVICSTLTFCATANPIRYEQAHPVFIDSDRTSWNLDPNLLEDELAECADRGKLPRAVVVVDLLGQSADIDSITQIARRYDIPVIEDAAQALGATYKGHPAGSRSWASMFSFNGNKIITTGGGGAICTGDQQLAQRARFFATQAIDDAPYYLHSEVGYNYRLSNVLAAIGLGQLEALDERVAARRRIRDFYERQLADLPGISFAPRADYGQSNAWLSAMVVDPTTFGASCDDIRQELEAENIESRRAWKPMHTQPVFANCRHRGGAVAEEVFQKALLLPSGTAMTDENLSRVVRVIRRARQSKTKRVASGCGS